MSGIDLSEVLLDDAVMLDVDPFANKTELFHYMAEQLQHAGIVKDAAEFIDALELREQCGSTYMGNFIAIPHGKSETVARTGVAFCRCKIPFLYESNGEKGEVRYVFMIAVSSHECTEHLRILAALAGMLAHQEFIDVLNEVDAYDALIQKIQEWQNKLAS